MRLDAYYYKSYLTFQTLSFRDLGVITTSGTLPPLGLAPRGN